MYIYIYTHIIWRFHNRIDGKNAMIITDNSIVIPMFFTHLSHPMWTMVSWENQKKYEKNGIPWRHGENHGCLMIYGAFPEVMDVARDFHHPNFDPILPEIEHPASELGVPPHFPSWGYPHDWFFSIGFSHFFSGKVYSACHKKTS